MSNQNNTSKPAGETREWLKSKGIPLLTLLLGIAITAGLFLSRDRIAELGNYGYLGAFLISLVTSATVLLPVPGLVVLIALGTSLNPVLVGLVGAAGGIIGEITGFMVGYGGRKVVENKSRFYMRAEGWMRRWGSWAVFAIASTPLPVFDIAGMVAGALHYPLWKFLLIGWVGKSIKTVAVVVAGVWGWEALLRYLG